MNTSTKILIVLLFAALTASCATTQSAEAPPDPYEISEFKAPLETALTVETGNAMFVRGSYVKHEEITLAQDISLMLPGSLAIPFPVTMKAQTLRLTELSRSWKYFCAADSLSTATFPGIGSVVAKGDCIGLRQSLASGKLEWVVDNSHHNGSTTIWSRDLRTGDALLLTKRTIDRPFRVRELTRIVFDGASGGQLRFTLEEVTAAGRSDKSFVFDRAATGDTVVGIKGRVFRVIQADNVNMRYAWVKL